MRAPDQPERLRPPGLLDQLRQEGLVPADLDGRSREVQADTPAEVMDLCRLAGDVDYLLRASFPDMAAYDAFYNRLTDAVPIKNITSHFVMEQLKQTTAYPIDTKSR